MLPFLTYLTNYLYQKSEKTKASPDAGDFDYYMMQLSYAPEFCRLHPDQQGQAECTGQFTLVLHGLWPQWTKPRTVNGEDYPQFCSTQYQNVNVTEVLKEVGDWAVIAPEYDHLAEHEWKRHGTCSGLSPRDYFALAVKLALAYKDTIANCENSDLRNRDFMKNLFPLGDPFYDQDGDFAGVNLYFSRDGQQIAKPN